MDARMGEEEYLDDFVIDLNSVKEHYLRREQISSTLRTLLAEGRHNEYVSLAVGITDPLANYSAHEHQLGPRILGSNSSLSVFDLANRLASPTLSVTQVPNTIYAANLRHLKISVGSEMACLLQPNRFWVCNVRTVWCHLIIKHEGDWARAIEELALYRDDDASSEMNYAKWSAIYRRMEPSLEVINRISKRWAAIQRVEPGELKYI